MRFTSKLGLAGWGALWHTHRMGAGTGPRLALYRFRSCIYCVYVERAIAHLGLEVEIRDIDKDPQAFQELVGARGRKTVPVLRIEEQDGHVEWLPESRDIVRYLERIAKERKGP